MKKSCWLALVALLLLPPAEAAAQDEPADFPQASDFPQAGDGLLGSGCELHQDCTEGLICFGAASTQLAGQGPAGGLCSAPCDSDLDCEPFQPEPLFPPACVAVQGESICLETCGDFGVRSQRPHNCHGREDFACASAFRIAYMTVELGECVPVCTSDSQCGDRFCDHSSGLCRDEPDAGAPIGSSCDPSASEPDCAGYCQPLSEAGGDDGAGGGDNAAGPGGTGMCTQLCVEGGPVGCGWSGESDPRAMCKSLVNTEPGDLSHCVELCDCDSECRTPGFVCEPDGYSGRIYGLLGQCVPQAIATESLPDCPTVAQPVACDFGPLKACRGPQNCLGTATCLGDESGYAACECVGGAPNLGEAGGGGGGAGGAGGRAGGGRAGEGEAGGGDRVHGQTLPPDCGCRVPAPRAGLGAGLFLATALVALRRRRRRALGAAH